MIFLNGYHSVTVGVKSAAQVGAIMTKLFFGIWLGLELICRRIDVDPELLLSMWQSCPAIEIYDVSPTVRRAELCSQLDRIFPF